jgi:hypothetical protein
MTLEKMMNVRFCLGASTLVVTCFGAAFACSDADDVDDGRGGVGGTASAGEAGSGAGGSGLSGAGMGGSGLSGAGMGGSGAAGQGGSGTGGGVLTGDLSFAEDIHPIFRALCIGCHDQEGSGLGSFSFAVADAADAYAAVTSDTFTGDPLYTVIVERIERGEMPLGTGCDGNPPGSPGCVSQADFEKIQQWAQSGSPPPP